MRRSGRATPSREDFASAFDQYVKGRQLRDRAFDLSQAKDYLTGACDIDDSVDFQRDSVQCFFAFDALLKDPAIIPVRLESFEKWKASYVQLLPQGATGPTIRSSRNWRRASAP